LLALTNARLAIAVAATDTKVLAAVIIVAIDVTILFYKNTNKFLNKKYFRDYL
jgi:hypothetical protein